MSEYQYILEPYNGKQSRHTCPKCGKAKAFSRYIDTETGGYIHPDVGRCNRENNCGYHYTPKQYFEDNGYKNNMPKIITDNSPQRKKFTSFIPVDIFKGSLQGYEDNHFIKYLISLFGETVTSELIGRYFIGTSKHWNGATVFWQIDKNGKIRTGKIMLYNSETGRRVKEPFNQISWVHTVVKLPDYKLKQCFFGEHLLKDNNKPVAIVESEKTAVIASVYLPQFIWLAAGSSEGLSEEKFHVLQDRNVVLYPDLNSFEKWNKKVHELSYIANISISDLLEKKATKKELEQGLDLADYLVRFNYTELSSFETISKPKPSEQKEESNTHTVKSNDIAEKTPEYKTIGDIIDYYKEQGNESLPDNIQINAPGWPGRPFKGKAAIFNKS